MSLAIFSRARRAVGGTVHASCPANPGPQACSTLQVKRLVPIKPELMASTQHHGAPSRFIVQVKFSRVALTDPSMVRRARRRQPMSTNLSWILRRCCQAPLLSRNREISARNQPATLPCAHSSFAKVKKSARRAPPALSTLNTSTRPNCRTANAMACWAVAGCAPP
jgi:hypothetical protein